MKKRGYWNKTRRLPHGPAEVVSRITPEDAVLLRQEALIRAEFGEEGVKKFWEQARCGPEPQGESKGE
jgi:predicted exporter